MGNLRDPSELYMPLQRETEPSMLGRQQRMVTPDSRRPSLHSLSDASQYRPGHLDRQPRLYHYRHPYVEDDFADDEEYYRRQDLIDMEQYGLHPQDYFGPFFDDGDPDSLQRRSHRG